MWSGSSASRTRRRRSSAVDELAGQLQASGRVEHGELLGHVVLLAGVRQHGAAQHLRGGPAVPDRDRAPHLVGHRLVVGDDHDRDAELAVGLAERGEDLVGGRGVELAGGLVGEQHLRGVRERHGDGDPLLLAAGQLGGTPVGLLPHTEQVEQVVHPLAPLGPPHPGHRHRHRHVLGGGQVGQQVARGLLPHEADRVPLVPHPLGAPHREQVVAGHPGRAGARGVEAGQDRRAGSTCRSRTPRRSPPARRCRRAGRGPGGRPPRPGPRRARRRR